jgi:hypothetical protein
MGVPLHALSTTMKMYALDAREGTLENDLTKLRQQVTFWVP